MLATIFSIYATAITSGLNILTIFFFNNLHNCYIFIILQLVYCTSTCNVIFNFKIIKKTKNQVVVVSLPAVQLVKLYILNVNNVSFVWVN